MSAEARTPEVGKKRVLQQQTARDQAAFGPAARQAHSVNGTHFLTYERFAQARLTLMNTYADKRPKSLQMLARFLKKFATFAKRTEAS